MFVLSVDASDDDGESFNVIVSFGPNSVRVPMFKVRLIIYDIEFWVVADMVYKEFGARAPIGYASIFCTGFEYRGYFITICIESACYIVGGD